MRLEKLRRNTFYPIGEGVTLPPGHTVTNTRAVWDGQPKRLPRKGEFYLSGAIIEAYDAPNDLSTEFHIAILVKGSVEWRPLSATNPMVVLEVSDQQKAARD